MPLITNPLLNTRTPICLISNNLDVNQTEKYTRCKSKNRWISAFEKMKLLPNLEEDLPLRGGGQLLVIRNVAAGCKA